MTGSMWQGTLLTHGGWEERKEEETSTPICPSRGPSSGLTFSLYRFPYLPAAPSARTMPLTHGPREVGMEAIMLWCAVLKIPQRHVFKVCLPASGTIRGGETLRKWNLVEQTQLPRLLVWSLLPFIRTLGSWLLPVVFASWLQEMSCCAPPCALHMVLCLTAGSKVMEPSEHGLKPLRL